MMINIRIRLYEFKLKLQVLVMRLLGRINKDGSPRKCPRCGCRRMETYQRFMDKQGYIEEYWVRCDECKKHIAVWAYGAWEYLDADD